MISRLRPPARGAALALAALLAPLAGCAPEAADGHALRAEILLDGAFGDWAGVPALLTDPEDAPEGSPVELGAVFAADDPAWLYLSVEVGRPVNAQALEGTLHLVLDTDADPATGGPAHGMRGADVVVDLSPRTADDGAAEAAPRGVGFGLRAVDASGPGAPRPSYDLGVAALPTWASDRFELRVSRLGTPDGLGRMGASVRLKLVAGSAAGAGDDTAEASYAFVTAPATAAPRATSLAPLETRAPGAFRVAQWNVSEGRFRSPAVHARLLAAVRPDVVLLDEVHEEISDEALAAFFALPELAALGTWRWVHSRGGGRQKTVVAARDRALRPEPSMASVDYAPGALDSLRARVPAAFHRALDLEARVQMSATGAWVDVGGAEVLFVPLDLQSAGWLGSPHDLLRAVQAETLHRHVLAALGAPGSRAPVVVGGDFNAVGSEEPVRILAAGLDADGSDLTVASPRRLGEASLFTWYDPRRGPFAPGRLDLTLYADAALEEAGGFVFDTADLSDAQLAALALERGMSAATSDHLILVTDLRLR